MKIKKIIKILLSLISSVLFFLFTKIKISPILGTKSKFSLSVFFGPTISKIFGIEFGTGIILFTHFFGTLFGLYKIKATKDLFTFFPIIFAGLYFAKIFKGEKKLIFIPLTCIILFIFHPIGKTVWFYSAFWLIPILISLFKEKLDKVLKIPIFQVFGYSLGSAFVDHAIGSVIFLYFLKIPSKFWIEAIPFTIIERILIAAGIEFCYFAEKLILKILEKIVFLLKIESLVFESK